MKVATKCRGHEGEGIKGKRGGLELKIQCKAMKFSNLFFLNKRIDISHSVRLLQKSNWSSSVLGDLLVALY